MKFKIQIIKVPNNEIVATSEQKKSKANFNLKEKLRFAYQTIKYFKYFSLHIDVREIDDLASYVDYLNNKEIYLNNAIQKIEDDKSKKLETAVNDFEKTNIEENINKNIEKIETKIDKVNKEYENAQSLIKAREDIAAMDIGEENNEDEIQSIETPSVEEPIMAPIEEVAEQPIVEENTSIMEETPIEVETTTEIQPIVEPVEEEQPVTINSTEEIPVENLAENKEEVVEQPKPEISKLEQFYKDYNNILHEIENNYKKSFERDLSELVARVKNETDKTIELQLSEMKKTATDAINMANKSTEKALNEKAIVEQDRDQYKSHYEQTVEIVNQKDETIKSKDDEIASLKSEIEKKNNELAAANEREIGLNKVIDKANKENKDLREDKYKLQISLATVAQQVLVEAKQENEELSQPIELGEVVESEETSKTL